MTDEKNDSREDSNKVNRFTNSDNSNSKNKDSEKISLSDVYSLLLEIKQMIKRTLRDESKIEKITENYENRLYDDVNDWQNAIWSSCKYKKEKQGSDSIYFYCTLLKDACSFERCPLNKIDNSKDNKNN